ncbi:hypothetical protein ACFL3M_01560 [Patescibacteria group bacterium]
MKKELGITITFLLLIIVVFYWFGYRSSQIKKECSKELRGSIELSGESRLNSGRLNINSLSPEEKYMKCLGENGL